MAILNIGGQANLYHGFASPTYAATYCFICISSMPQDALLIETEKITGVGTTMANMMPLTTTTPIEYSRTIKTQKIWSFIQGLNPLAVAGICAGNGNNSNLTLNGAYTLTATRQ